MHSTSDISQEILTASDNEKINYFINFTVVHRLLKQVYEEFLDAINNPGGASLIFLFGPTGVGKTTLMAQVMKIIFEQNQALMIQDLSFLPIAGVEARSPDTGSFDWKVYYKSVLIALSEPFADYKTRTGSHRVYGNGGEQKTVKVKPNLVDLRADVEHIFQQRRLKVFLVDEAQRFAKITSGHKQQDQMDAIQSMASFTQTRHGLFGTYELLQLRNLSGQLSRRSIDIHFPRYQSENPEDIKDFQRVLKSFSFAMPLPETPDLEKHWDYFYERSIGCVGIVKDWLTQSLRKALSESSNCLSYKHLQAYAPAVSKSVRMLTEAIEGENILSSGENQVEKLRSSLGLVVRDNQNISVRDTSSHHNLSTSAETKNNRKKRRPGERKINRDIVGGGGNAL
ncbi:ATP-binding protein [Calothrix sp. 336/3]|uniref:ATP-binding protein n=1 Tax=Calothrix sp. 336/3 TaxID=1337936 RepID=UPI00069AF4DB|nr:ATP-binding protein [Calothrix sp. 336/3]